MMSDGVRNMRREMRMGFETDGYSLFFWIPSYVVGGIEDCLDNLRRNSTCAMPGFCEMCALLKF